MTKLKTALLAILLIMFNNPNVAAMKFDRHDLEKLPHNVLAQKHPRPGCLSNLSSMKKDPTNTTQLFTLVCHDGFEIRNVSCNILSLSAVLKKQCNTANRSTNASNKIEIDPSIDSETLEVLINYMEQIVEEKAHGLSEQDIIDNLVCSLKPLKDIPDDLLEAAYLLNVKIFFDAIKQLIIHYIENIPCKEITYYSTSDNSQDDYTQIDDSQEYLQDCSSSYDSKDDGSSESSDNQNNDFSSDEDQDDDEDDNDALKNALEKLANPYKCQICQKVFKRKNYFESHIKRHNGKKDILCPYDGCDKAFTLKDYLNKHIKRVHKNERPFACPYDKCNKSFVQRNHLNDHIKTHTGQKPFACTYEGCNYASNIRSNLTRHLKTCKRKRQKSNVSRQ